MEEAMSSDRVGYPWRVRRFVLIGAESAELASLYCRTREEARCWAEDWELSDYGNEALLVCLLPSEEPDAHPA
jgi:hypothetical protein